MAGADAFFPTLDDELGRPDLAPEGTRELNILDVPDCILDPSFTPRVAGLFIYNHNPVAVHPRQDRVREALAREDLFVVGCDVAMTDSMAYADVILPATTHLEKVGTYTNTDRRVQVGRKALHPPGSAREDWKIVSELSTAFGYPMRYDSPSAVFDEMTSLAPSYSGLTHENLGLTGKLWPCPDLETDGVQVLFGDAFPTPDGLGRFAPAEFTPAAEPPDDEYPFILNTGRLLEHWHTGTMTRRSRALHAIAPEARVEIHPDDLAALGVGNGGWVNVASRRGSITLTALASEAMLPGSVFIPFHFR